MGYVPKRKIYTLEFTDPDMDGLEVRIRGLTTGQRLDIDTAVAAGTDEAIRSVLELMADRMVSWNVEGDDGQPLPISVESMLGLDLDFNMAILNAWTEAVSGVSAPLEPSSDGGPPSLVASIPTEVLSESPESTAVPA